MSCDMKDSRIHTAAIGCVKARAHLISIYINKYDTIGINFIIDIYITVY